MKNNCWLILGLMLSTSVWAQQATNPVPAATIAMPPAAPAARISPATTATTNAPAAKTAKKKSAAKKSEKAPQKKAGKSADNKAVAKKKEALPELKSVALVAGPAMVVASNVNVRGQARLKSEVVTRITKGQSVSVIEEIVRNNSGPEEPSAWAKIALPSGAHVWINTAFINPADKTVKPKKLNLRSGPGENFSVIGLLHQGDAVKEITTKAEWTEIEAPAGAYAFVAAQYLKQGLPEAPAIALAPTPAPAPAPVPPEPPPTPTAVAAAPTVAPPPSDSPVVPASTEPAAAVTPPAATPAPAAPPTEPVVTEPPPPRIVQREGIVRGMTSIQAPSKFVLVSPQNGRDIDYLYTTSKQLDLRRYKGLRIIVTGEEGLDERWGNTPVLTIQKILVVE